MGDMRGIGWVILFQDPATDRLTNHWVSLHQDGVPAGFKPLLVMDVWEARVHAGLQSHRQGEVRRGVLPQRRLGSGRRRLREARDTASRRGLAFVGP
jgi:hypothetical protein